MADLSAALSGVLLTVAYDGTGFHGWAAQPGVRTVQGTLQEALRKLDPEASLLRGASRTDAGVHAEGQLVGVDVFRRIAPRGWVLGLNKVLPEDLSVRQARLVPIGYNPRHEARRKRYGYRLQVDAVRDPHLRLRVWRVAPPVDLARLGREAEAAVGTHDFASFRAASDGREHTVRTMFRVETAVEGRVVRVVVEGNAFMHNMVRILVGTLVDVARGRLAEGAVARALAVRDRRVAGMTAPAQGLTLEQIEVALPEGVAEMWPEPLTP
ncbi:MAG: tRNA pseudouridine(38-40) synthase TruA [Myxococcales bacterium]